MIMKWYAIEWAYPTSPFAKELGHYKNGCYFLACHQRREDGTWEPPYAVSQVEATATSEEAKEWLVPALFEYIRNPKAELFPKWLKFNAAWFGLEALLEQGEST